MYDAVDLLLLDRRGAAPDDYSAGLPPPPPRRRNSLHSSPGDHLGGLDRLPEHRFVAIRPGCDQHTLGGRGLAGFEQTIFAGRDPVCSGTVGALARPAGDGSPVPMTLWPPLYPLFHALTGALGFELTCAGLDG